MSTPTKRTGLEIVMVRGSPAEGLHSPREESDFGGIVGLVDRNFVGGCGLVGLAEAAEQVGADRVEYVVALER